MRVMNLARGCDPNSGPFSDFLVISLLDHLEAATVAATAALGLLEEEEGLAAAAADSPAGPCGEFSPPEDTECEKGAISY